MKTEILRARVNPEQRKEAENVLNRLGLTTGDAINIFLNQIVIQRGIPFLLTTERHLELSNASINEISERYKNRIPNDESIIALNEDLSKAKRFKSAKGLLKHLKS